MFFGIVRGFHSWQATCNRSGLLKRLIDTGYKGWVCYLDADAFVADLILAALAPSAIEVSVQLAEDIELERTAKQRHWAQRLERAHYETTLARRHHADHRIPKLTSDPQLGGS